MIGGRDLTRGDQIKAEDSLAKSAEHQYPRKTTYLAVARMLAGIGVVGGLCLLIGGVVATVVAAVLVVIFVVYGAKAIMRGQDKIDLTSEGLLINTWRPGDASDGNIKELPFSEISGLRLAYYSTRRDGEKGWMELVLKTPKAKLVVESEIKGFRQIAMTCYAHAKRQGVRLTLASERNFEVLLGEGVRQRFITDLGGSAGVNAGADIGVAGVSR